MAPIGLDRVRERIATACRRADRDVSNVSLVAVSKNQPDASIVAAHAQGQLVFAENREQGLKARMGAELPDDIAWHFVGPLQRRKVNFVGTHVSLLQSMDRMSLAERWAERSTAPVLVQFNLATEPQKSGFDPVDADRVVEALHDLGLSVKGVMAIPPHVTDPEDARPWFRMLREIFDRCSSTYPAMDVCSMGMSHNLEVAIEEGATMVRVGRAIFAP